VEEGFELGTFYMPEYAGLSSDGKFLFYTEAGGVTRNVADAERRVVGHALPDFEIGWSNYFTVYKNIDISFTLRAVVGSDVLNVTRMVFANPTVLPSLNGLTEVLDEVERGVDDFPKVNSYYLEDGSFLKLDNVTIGYNFDVATLDWLQKLRVYVVGNNLLTLTKYTGIDPEISYNGLSFGLDQYNTYPKVRSFTMGLNVTF
jgi:iron complex outermembrane receptor protein